jgi:hypothetical protein
MRLRGLSSIVTGIGIFLIVIASSDFAFSIGCSSSNACGGNCEEDAEGNCAHPPEDICTPAGTCSCTGVSLSGTNHCRCRRPYSG